MIPWNFRKIQIPVEEKVDYKNPKDEMKFVNGHKDAFQDFNIKPTVLPPGFNDMKEKSSDMKSIYPSKFPTSLNQRFISQS
jgi:DNA/RNA-binding domain of Phe-tRNA-synthetase-like protein